MARLGQRAKFGLKHKPHFPQVVSADAGDQVQPRLIPLRHPIQVRDPGAGSQARPRLITRTHFIITVVLALVLKQDLASSRVQFLSNCLGHRNRSSRLSSSSKV